MEDYFDLSDAGSDGVIDSLMAKVKNRKRMKDVAKEFLASSEYSAAQRVLQSLLKMTDEADARMDVLFQLAECDVMLERKISEETNERMLSLIHSNETNCHEMREMAEQRDGVQSIIAFYYTCKLFKEYSDSTVTPKNAEACIMKAARNIEEMAKRADSRRQAHKSYPLLFPMLADMKQITTSNIELKASSEGTCYAKMGYLLNKLGKNSDAFVLMKKGREHMESLIGAAKCARYDCYASLAHNMSAALVVQGKFKDAVYYLKMAIDEMERVEDISVNEKEGHLVTFREELRGEMDLVARMMSGEIEEGPALEWACSQAHRMASREEGFLGASQSGSEIKDFAKTLFEDGGLPKARPKAERHSGTEDLLNETLDQAVKEIVKNGHFTDNTAQKLLTQLNARRLSWGDVRRMAENRSGAAAVVLHLYTCKMLPFMEAPDKVLKEIGESFRRSRNSIDEMIKGSDAGPAHNLVSLLHRMIDELRGVTNGRENLKATVEANCLNKLGSIYTQISKYQLAVEYLTEGCKVMSDHFGESAKRHSVFSSLANNIGYAYSKNKDYVRAVEYYKTAYDNMKTAQDVTELVRNEKLTAYKKAFQSALSSLDGQDPEKAVRIRKAEATHEIMQDTRTKRGRDREEQKPTSPNAFQTKGSLVNVGRGVYVDHKKPLRHGYQVYHGKYGNEDVAVKRIDFSDEHCREVELIKTLPKHKNLVEFKGWAEWESKETPGVKAIYMAMELCDKETLFELAPKTDVFLPEDRLQALLQFTQGLRHIHSHNIIHGDLKPHNLLRSRGEGVVKVADFGISKKLEWGRTHLTVSTQAGTFGWMAPDEKLTKKSDIFSAGLIYCYVLSGGETLTQDKDFKKLNCEDAVIARDLISWMTDLDLEKRPTVEECCESPLFWDVSRKISFLCEFSRHMAASSPECAMIKLVERQASDIFGENWLEKLAPRDTVEVEPNAVEHDVTKPAIEQVVYERAKVVEGSSSVSSLLQLVADFRNEMKVQQQQENDVAFLNDQDIWNFFNTRFPNLFLSVHKIAYKSGFLLSTEEKLKLISSSASEANLDERMTHIVNDSWFDQLILDEGTVERMQENVYRSSHHYKISEYAMYNKAVSKDRADEADYDEKSLTSLLRFISNRQKYFKEDGMFAQWLFGDETEGIWDFFSGIFPNIIDELVSCKNISGKSEIPQLKE